MWRAFSFPHLAKKCYHCMPCGGSPKSTRHCLHCIKGGSGDRCEKSRRNAFFQPTMGNAVTISGSRYTVRGTVQDKATQQGVLGLNVVAYDKDLLSKDDYLGIGVTDAAGNFEISFDASAFQFLIFDRKPTLYFVIDDGGTVLLSTKEYAIHHADPSTPDIHLSVDLSDDKLRKLINPTAVPGWVGGFAESNPAFAYPTPDLSSLEMLDNLANIPLLQRQQKVVWPEFSWETDPGAADPRRCYQMFAPDISRLGYTNEGRVYSIICPQQGACSPTLGSLNVEVTVTGNRGWADEANRELAADMTVVGKIWFGPSAHEGLIVKDLAQFLAKHNHTFPFTKENAIKVQTFRPNDPTHPIFPLTKGETKAFPIPDFARHEGLAWSVGHLGVEIGNIEKTGEALVDDFNQMILDIFNMASGNMLRAGNTLTWNVWFTAPELVDQAEWAAHAEKWRTSIDADHGSPYGNGSTARYFDGSPFEAAKTILLEEGAKLAQYWAKHRL
jgi:hypothetical protein